MLINTNIPALNSLNKLHENYNALNKTLKRLSSGMRINSAADDAAGLAISEKMRAQIRGLAQAGRNIQDGISLIQTAEGALQEVHSILQRMNELAIQSANGNLLDDDRDKIQLEFELLMNEIDKIAKDTNFNNLTLFDGDFLGIIYTGTDKLQVDIGAISTEKLFDIPPEAPTDYGITGADAMNMPDEDFIIDISKDENNDYYISFTGYVFKKYGRKVQPHESYISANEVGVIHRRIGVYFNYESLREGQVIVQVRNGVATVLYPTPEIKKFSIDTQVNATSSIKYIRSAIGIISSERSKLGAYQNRLEHALNNVSNYKINLTAAESRIRDADLAKEIMEFTKHNILMQASQAILAQANHHPNAVIQLLN